MNKGPRVLVVDGNLAATRAKQVAAGGHPSGEAYAAVLQDLVPAVHCDIVRPADAEVRLPAGLSLGDYAGVAITGSALTVYEAGDHIDRQVELARAVFATGVPFFGSCWGLQVAVTAAGGTVTANPRGREFGFGRRIALNAAGRAHPMFAGKPDVFEAVTVHRDCIATLPPNAVALASNDMGLQAAEVRHERGTFWGVQYHPEYSYREIAATAVRYGDILVDDGLFPDRAALDQYVADLRALESRPTARDLLWRHGLGPSLSNPDARYAEIRNWLIQRVLPHSQRQ